MRQPLDRVAHIRARAGPVIGTRPGGEVCDKSSGRIRDGSILVRLGSLPATAGRASGLLPSTPGGYG